MRQISSGRYSHLQGRTFYNGTLLNFLQPDSFFTLLCAFIYKTQFNLTISSHLPGLLDYCRTLKLRTFYNSDGLINWLRQPRQFCNQALKVYERIGLAARRTGATFFARYRDYFIVTRNFSAVYRDLVPFRQFHRDPKLIRLPGLAKNMSPRRRRQLIKPPGR